MFCKLIFSNKLAFILETSLFKSLCCCHLDVRWSSWFWSRMIWLWHWRMAGFHIFTSNSLSEILATCKRRKWYYCCWSCCSFNWICCRCSCFNVGRIFARWNFVSCCFVGRWQPQFPPWNFCNWVWSCWCRWSIVAWENPPRVFFRLSQNFRNKCRECHSCWCRWSVSLKKTLSCSLLYVEPEFQKLIQGLSFKNGAFHRTERCSGIIKLITESTNIKHTNIATIYNGNQYRK